MKVLSTSFFLLVISFFSIAQESINTVGGDFSGENGSVAYSVGQIFYQSIESSNGSVLEGIQQAYEITVNHTEDLSPNLIAKVYPNPTQNVLLVEITDFDTQNSTHFQLSNVNGQVLLHQNLNKHQEQVNTTNLANGIYFIMVYQNNQLVNSFKVIKQ